MMGYSVTMFLLSHEMGKKKTEASVREGYSGRARIANVSSVTEKKKA
jgi:hypothetical protein